MASSQGTSSGLVPPRQALVALILWSDSGVTHAADAFRQGADEY